MGTLIKLGLLVVCLLILVAFLGYKFVINKIKKALAKVVTGAQPARVHLQRDRELEWSDRQAVAGQVQALRVAGFRTITTYRIIELEDFKLVALAHPEEGYAAVVYEHQDAGVWSDIVAMYADGTSLTLSSAPSGGELAQPPRHSKVYLKKASVAKLLRALPKHLRDAPRVAALPANFVELFEKAYAEEMAWRLSQDDSGEEIETLERDDALDRRCEPLFAAITAGHAGRLGQLLETGIVPAGRDEKGRTPLIAAAALGHLDLVQALLGADADVDARAPGTPGESDFDPGDALAYAAEQADDPEAKKFLGGFGALVGAGRPKPLNVTALTAAIEAGHPQVVTALIQAGVDFVGRGGLTPLQFAAGQGDPEIVRALLVGGADVDQPGEDGYTPLMSAASEGFVEVIRLLLDAAADPSVKSDGETAIILAAESGHREVVDVLAPLVKARLQRKAEKLLAEWGEDQSFDPAVKRLMTAAQNGSASMVAKLLAGGLHPDTPQGDDEPMTALMLAAQAGHVAVLEVLLAAGANVNQEIEGDTPLARAAWPPSFMDAASQPVTIQTLVAAGASLDPLGEEERSRVIAVMSEGVSA